MSLGLPVVPGGFIAEFASPPWQCSHLVGWLRTSRTLARYAYAPDEFYAELVAAWARLTSGRFAADFTHARRSVPLHLVGSLRSWRRRGCPAHAW
jgi:hypothetical protein